jgi:hypothetical protein
VRLLRLITTVIALAAWLCLARAVRADGESDTETTPVPAEQPASGPLLQPSDYAPVLCDPGRAGFRYVEIRGSGFDAWTGQHLLGNLTDAGGNAQIQWPSVWVSPGGRLTLEVNLCTDPFRGRPALPAGDYTVSVSPADGGPIASANISIMPPVQ